MLLEISGSPHWRVTVQISGTLGKSSMFWGRGWLLVWKAVCVCYHDLGDAENMTKGPYEICHQKGPSSGCWWISSAHNVLQVLQESFLDRMLKQIKEAQVNRTNRWFRVHVTCLRKHLWFLCSFLQQPTVLNRLLLDKNESPLHINLLRGGYEKSYGGKSSQ